MNIRIVADGSIDHPLSHLYQTSDAVLTMENDVLHNICSQLMGLKKVSFGDINKVVSHKLASILQPAYCGSEESSWRGEPIKNHLGEILLKFIY